MSKELIKIEIEEEYMPDTTYTERMNVRGSELVSTIKNLIKESTIRRIIIKRKDGQELLEIPLALGIVGMAAFQMLTVVGLIAAVVAECSIEIERRERTADDDEDTEDIIVGETVDISKEDAVDFDEEIDIEMDDLKAAASNPSPDQCHATTRSGNQCRNKVSDGSGYCYIHG